MTPSLPTLSMTSAISPTNVFVGGRNGGNLGDLGLISNRVDMLLRLATIATDAGLDAALQQQRIGAAVTFLKPSLTMA